MARGAQGAVGWLVFLLSAPWFALPAYALLGDHKYREYIKTRRASHQVTGPLGQLSGGHMPGGHPDTRLPAFERIAGLPAVRGNGARLLINGRSTFDAIFEAIDAAERYVCVQFYTVHEDGLGHALSDRLVAAAARGVAVRFLYDGVGSYGLSRAFVDRLEAAGVAFVPHMSVRGPWSRLKVNFRNHRKTVVVDGRVGFIGGHNVGDAYLGLKPDFGEWRDTHLRLTGPMVTQLQTLFAEDWHWATAETLDAELEWHPAPDPEDRVGLIVGTGPADEMDTGAMFFFSAIAVAEERVWIATPYFVPDIDVLSALKHAALRGLDVRLIVPDVIDRYLPWTAAFAYFDEVRAAGVEIHRYESDFMHQKVLLVDRDIAAVGTTNLDNRSFRLNFEAMALFFDEGFAADVAAMLEADLERSVRLDRTLSEQALAVRVGAPLARLLAPIL